MAAGSRTVLLRALRLADSRPVRLALAAGLLAAAAFAFDDARLVQVSVWLIYGMLTMSLAFVWGQAGILVFGQNAFFGVAAYLYGILAINLLGVTHETLSALLAAAIGAAMFAFLLGYFMFYGRVGAVYVAIVTLAVSLVINTLLAGTAGPQYRVGEALLGGYNGMTGIPPVVLGIPGVGGTALGPQHAYLFFGLLAVLSYGFISWLLRRPFGRIVVSVRENELRTELLGYDVRWYRLLAFTIGGGVAGLAGACFAAWGFFVNPAVFGLEQAALLVIWFLVGGQDALAGGFFGAALVQGLTSYLGSGAGGRQTQMILGTLLIAMVLLLPGGLAGLINRLVGRFREREQAPTPVGAQSGASGSGPVAPVGSQESMLIVKNLAKSFDGLRAVDGVSLEFGHPGIHCLIGPNGAGKSTFFNMLIGRYTPTSGTITFDDRDVSRLPSHRRSQMGIGIKLQLPCLYPGLPVWENVWLAAYAHIRDQEPATAAVPGILAQMGLMERANEQAGNLSHGEQQWLEIGMVLAASPRLVLLDEPSAGMTREETLKMVEMVQSIGRDAGVVVVEHDMEFVRRLGAPVTVFHQGRILTQGSVKDVRQDPRVLDVYLGRDSHAAGG